MSSEIIEVTAKAVRGARFVARIKQAASAHPIAAAAVGTVTVGFAGYGAYKATKSLFKRKPAPVKVEPVVVRPAPTPEA